MLREHMHMHALQQSFIAHWPPTRFKDSSWQFSDNRYLVFPIQGALSLVGQMISISVLSDSVMDYAQGSRRAQKGPLISPACSLWTKELTPDLEDYEA